ncbi:MAG: hypothetical protein E6713_02885 [Sporomusaceae bacterium]|nr:hypothetical protein [Sporomusaceae bacterium]
MIKVDVLVTYKYSGTFDDSEKEFIDRVFAKAKNNPGELLLSEENSLKDRISGDELKILKLKVKRSDTGAVIIERGRK